MVFHMKTTLVIPDPIYRLVKKRAVESRTTVSSLVAEYLRQGLARPGRVAELPALPSYRCGRERVDVADRDALHDVLDAG